MSHIYLKPRQEYTILQYQLLLVFYEYKRSRGFF